MGFIDDFAVIAFAALLHEDPAGVGRRGPQFSGPSAGATLQG